MDYYNDEHDEDDLPEVSLSMTHYRRKMSNDTNHSNPSLENWQNLYETSIHSLQSDEEDQRSTTQKPLYLEPQIPIERPDSPISESQSDSNTNKSKWEIRLPELLNSMVGPDRQKRDVSRRHTTDIVFQQSPDSPLYSVETEVKQPKTNPLVKLLKQKFDEMTTNVASIDDTTNLSPTKKFQRVGSLTCRGLTANTGERIVQRSRPALPIRPTTEITPVKSRSVNSRMTITSNRNHRDKSGPPVSYPKHYYPPPSTTSVVKQLLGGGATLVYDSRTQKSTSKAKPSIIKHQRSVEQTKEDLKSTNSVLTGRQLLPDNAKLKKNNNNNNHEPFKSNEDENSYEPIIDRTLYNSSRKKSIEASTESYNRRRNTNGNERENYNPVYDIDIKN